MLPISLLSGTIIGAGIFALPFVFYTTGIALTSAYAVLFAACAACIYLMYGDVLKHHAFEHRLAGLARLYLGRTGELISFVVGVLQMFFVLTAYLILSSSFVHIFLPAFAGLGEVLFFWIVGSLFIFWKVRGEAIAEFVATVGIILAVCLVFFSGVDGFFAGISSYPMSTSSLPLLLFPFGTLLFSFAGRSIVPDVISYGVERDFSTKQLRLSVIGGVLIALIVYLAFVIGMLGMWSPPSSDSFGGIIDHVPSSLVLSLSILGALAMWSSYFAIGSDLFRSLHQDFRVPLSAAALLVIGMPLALYLMGLSDFLQVIGITGGIFTACELGLIVLIWVRSQQGTLMPRSRYVPLAVLAILSVSICYTLYTVIF